MKLWRGALEFDFPTAFLAVKHFADPSAEPRNGLDMSFLGLQIPNPLLEIQGSILWEEYIASFVPVGSC